MEKIKKSPFSPGASMDKLTNAAITVLFEKGKLNVKMIQEYPEEDAKHFEDIFGKDHSTLVSNSGETAVLHFNADEKFASDILNRFILSPKYFRNDQLPALAEMSESFSGEALFTVGKLTKMPKKVITYDYDENFQLMQEERIDTISFPEVCASVKLSDETRVRKHLDSMVAMGDILKEGNYYVTRTPVPAKMNLSAKIFTVQVGATGNPGENVNESNKYPFYFKMDVQKAIDATGAPEILFKRYTSLFKGVKIQAEHYGKSSQVTTMEIETTRPEENILLSLIRYFNEAF